MEDKLAIFMPVMQLEDVAKRRNAIVDFTAKAMQKDIDFGVIPGATKPTLLKPGAEKLCTLFGLSPQFTIIKSVEDWVGKEYGGEPFFYYLYHCSLKRGDYLVGEGDGSCNSHETKYRYRNARPVCPNCGKEAIIKGKEEYGGGWLCFAKKGGCGAKFVDGDTAITEQQVGKVLNTDVADQANTILKMAQKRALIAATLIAVNASEFFTQDIEDMAIDGVAVEVKSIDKATGEIKSPSTTKQSAKLVSLEQRDALYKLYKELHPGTDDEINAALKNLIVETFSHPAEQLTVPEWSQLMTKLYADKSADKAKPKAK
jgi:hypothetical protein